MFYIKLKQAAICIKQIFEEMLFLGELKVYTLVQLTKRAIFKMNYLEKLHMAKFIRGLKMGGWFICGIVQM